MRTKLATAVLIALSVSALTAELSDTDVSYEPSDLAEAITAESEGANRVTAIEALENALEDMEKPSAEAEAEAGHTVAKGKAITSKVGILSAGDEVTAEMLAGGEAALAALVKAGHIA